MRRVNPKVYTEEYYLSDCTGYEEFIKTDGKKLDITLQQLSEYINVIPGMNVLDIGCGRGEIVFFCASNGALSTGIDYSSSAIKLSSQARNKYSKKVREKSKFIKMDAKNLKFKSSSFDLIIMSNIVEHLYPEELDKAFKEVKRVLKPNGTLIVNTAPNKIFNDFTYKYYCYPVSSIFLFIYNKLKKNKYPNILAPKDIRTDSHHIMHINEPTYFSLKNYFNRYNFIGKIKSTNITVVKQHNSFKDDLFNFLVFLHPLSKTFPLNSIFGSDFICILKNKK